MRKTFIKTIKKSLIKKNTFLLAAVLFSSYGFCQVGINTAVPQSTLDVTAGLGTADIDGLQAPRLTRAQLTLKGNALYGANQRGALVYITDVTGGDAVGPRIDITTVGYYYFDGTQWVKVNNNKGRFSWEYHGQNVFSIVNNRSAATDVSFGHIDRESTPGAYNSSTGIFTCPYKGKYEVRYSLYWPDGVIYWGVVEMYVGNFTQKRISRVYEYAGTCKVFYGLTSTKSEVISANAGDQLKFFVAGAAYTSPACDTFRAGSTTALGGGASEFPEAIGTFVGDYSTMGPAGSTVYVKGIGDLSIVYLGE